MDEDKVIYPTECEETSNYFINLNKANFENPLSNSAIHIRLYDVYRVHSQSLLKILSVQKIPFALNDIVQNITSLFIKKSISSSENQEALIDLLKKEVNFPKFIHDKSAALISSNLDMKIKENTVCENAGDDGLEDLFELWPNHLTESNSFSERRISDSANLEPARSGIVFRGGDCSAPPTEDSEFNVAALPNGPASSCAKLPQSKGVGRCYRRNAHALIASIFVTVALFGVVLCLEPEFLEPMENVTVTEGRDATFTCVVDHLGGFKVAWIKADTKAILAIHNRVITHNNRMSVIHSDHNTWELTIKSVRRNDSGEYMCQINTDPMKNQVGYLNVVIPPDIISDDTSGDIMVPEGSPVKLTCNARGFPEPTITWRREDNTAIMLRSQSGTKSEVMVWEGKELFLEKVTRDDMGAYMCIASNDIPPAVSKRIVVMVHFHPLVRIPNQLVGAPQGTDVTLECEVEASPKSINYWTKQDTHGPVIVDSRKYVNDEIARNPYTMVLRLTVKNLDKGDFTTYSCTAKNSLGEVVGTIKLYEIEPPSPRTTATEPPVTSSRDLLHPPNPKNRYNISFNGDHNSQQFNRNNNRYKYSTSPPSHFRTTPPPHFTQTNFREHIFGSSGAPTSFQLFHVTNSLLYLLISMLIALI